MSSIKELGASCPVLEEEILYNQHEEDFNNNASLAPTRKVPKLVLTSLYRPRDSLFECVGFIGAAITYQSSWAKNFCLSRTWPKSFPLLKTLPPGSVKPLTIPQFLAFYVMAFTGADVVMKFLTNERKFEYVYADTE